MSYMKNIMKFVSFLLLENLFWKDCIYINDEKIDPLGFEMSSPAMRVTINHPLIESAQVTRRRRSRFHDHLL